MNEIVSRDPFGRPELVKAIGWIKPTLVALIAGSVWPPPARSETPPFDTISMHKKSPATLPANGNHRGLQ